MPTIPIHFSQAPSRRYDVVIGDGILSEVGPRLSELLAARGQPTSKRAFLVIDDGLPKTLPETVRASLEAAGFVVSSTPIHATEANKTLDTAARLLHQITTTRHERHDPIIALGGGIVGDLAGYVASVYRRGVPVVQCPTTLLSMVDASVGGKTGVNVASGTTLKKNLVGCFWQPLLVMADVAALTSLPERHLHAGFAECLKHGLISAAVPGQSDLLQWTSHNLLRFRMGDGALMAQLIERNVQVKASFVTDDEREEKPSEAGGRALLNLGHTFGHAVETIPHLSPDGMPDNAPLLHGEAVALGLVAAAWTSHAMGLLSKTDAEAVRIAVERAGLPWCVIGLPSDDAILTAMGHDKKVAANRLRLILPTAIGTSKVFEDPPGDAVRLGLGAIRR